LALPQCPHYGPIENGFAAGVLTLRTNHNYYYYDNTEVIENPNDCSYAPVNSDDLSFILISEKYYNGIIGILKNHHGVKRYYLL
jgi:hypothetical protein